MSSYPQDTIETLKKWCAERSVIMDPTICLAHDNQSGIGVFSTERDIRPQTILVKISKSSVLSARSCCLAGVIPSASHGLAAQLSLSLALFVELLRGIKSQWHGYLQSLPVGIVDLPIFWDLQRSGETGTGSACLRGTEAAKICDSKLETGRTLLEEIKRFYYETAEPVLLQHISVWQFETDRLPTLYGFYRAFSLVSSRAFLVDAHHGLAMVPIADAFNHVLQNHVHLESDYNVCAECGSLHECVHDREDQKSDLSDTPDDDAFYEMVSNAEIPPHTEIFNTYGEDLSNAQLLTRYGFILDVNDNDRITWSLQDILELFSPGLPSVDLRHYRAWLRDHCDFSTSQMIYREAGIDDMFCLDADGAVSHSLWALLFALASPDSGSGPAGVDLLPEVFSLQIGLEAATDDDDEDGGWDTAPPTPRALSTLTTMCRIAVRLCAERKASSGPLGCSDEEITDMLDAATEDPADGAEARRTRMALALVIGEHSVLDACSAAWSAVMDAASELVCCI